MKLKAVLDLYAGGPGSGCRGPNCGRKGFTDHGLHNANTGKDKHWAQTKGRVDLSPLGWRGEGNSKSYAYPVRGERRIGTIDTTISRGEAQEVVNFLKTKQGFDNVTITKSPYGRGYAIGWGDPKLLAEFLNGDHGHAWRGRALGFSDQTINDHLHNFSPQELHVEDRTFLKNKGVFPVAGEPKTRKG